MFVFPHRHLTSTQTTRFKLKIKNTNRNSVRQLFYYYQAFQIQQSKMSYQNRLRNAYQGNTDKRQPGQTSNDWKSSGYQGIIGHLTQKSQAFESGDLNRNNVNNLNTKRRRSTQIIEEDEDDEQFHSYYQKAPLVQTKSNRQGSLAGSNVNDNYNASLLESKIHQTKDELNERISELERIIRREVNERQLIEEYVKKHLGKFYSRIKLEENEKLEQIVSQLNKSLNTINKRTKVMEAGMADEKQEKATFQKKFNEFVQEVEEKMEKLMNIPEANASIHRSMSRNVDANYMMSLKSSIKEIPVAQSNLLGLEEIKAEIADIHDNLRSLSYDLEETKREIKNIERNPVPTKPQVSTQQTLEMSESIANKFTQMKEDIRRMDKQLQDFCVSYNGQKNEVERVLGIQEQNIIGMNEMFNKVINTSIVPKLKKVQDQVQSIPDTLETRMEALKKNIVRDLESMPIIRVGKLGEKKKIQRAQELSKNSKQRQLYLLDEENYILDCLGKYLVDDSNKRVRLEQEQIYYLQQVQGIQFTHTNSSDMQIQQIHAH